MAPACTGIHKALCCHLPIESDTDVALQGHFINYKYASTPSLCRNLGLYVLWRIMSGCQHVRPKIVIINLALLLGRCQKTSPSFDLVSIAL